VVLKTEVLSPTPSMSVMAMLQQFPIRHVFLRKAKTATFRGRCGAGDQPGNYAIARTQARLSVRINRRLPACP
jgi:hypothetical protein